VCIHTGEPIGLSCEEPEQNFAPPNPQDSFASEPYATIREAVRVALPTDLPLDPSGYPDTDEYEKWLKPVVEDFMTDSYHGFSAAFIPKARYLPVR
jgi:hypothetical protein